jgi:hypothetical protein
MGIFDHLHYGLAELLAEGMFATGKRQEGMEPQPLKREEDETTKVCVRRLGLDARKIGVQRAPQRVK